MSDYVFSLRSLPDEARLHVIKSFNIPELIAFSLTSARAETLVKSFNMKIDETWVVVAKNSLSINIRYKLGDEKDSNSTMLIKTLHTLPGEEDDTTYTWRNPELSFNEWFQHFQFLFKSENYSIGFDVNQENFDTVALRNLLPEWNFSLILEASTNYGEKLFDLFSTRTKIFFSKWGDRLLQFPQKVGIQNLDYLNYEHTCTLDDLLLLNATRISVDKFSLSDLNRFLKSWIRGSNPRLRHAFVDLIPEGGPIIQNEESELNKQILFDGIKYQVKANELERKMKNETIRGGIDIRNKKGRLATIIVDYLYWDDVKFYVWD